jgi:Tfp pilus assembly protein PilV
MSPRSSPVYDRWLTTCLASALPVRDVLPLMDFILSEHPTSVSHNPKRESMIDVCTAMLILIRSDLIRASSAHMDSTGQKKDLWGNEMAEEVVFDMKDAHRPEHDRKLMFNRELSLIRDYPGEAVGIDEILRVAWDIRQQRTLASMESSEVDDTDLTDEENDADAEDSLINKLSSLATMASKDVADRWAHTQMSGSVLPRPKVVRESIEAGSNLFRQYAAGVQESDAAASVAKASSNLTASALARWSTPANLTSSNNGNDGVPRKRSTSVQSDWGVRMPSTGNIWGNMASAARQAATTVAAVAGAASVDNREDRLTALPPRPVTPKRVPSVAGANLSRRDTNLPPSHFISPRGSIVYPAGRHRHRTAQSDGKISLQSRLAAIATGATQAESPRERERTGIRPLMLSASARPASPPLSINSKSKSIDGGSPSNVFGSPVGSAASLDIEYYVPRKISLRRASGDGTIPVSSIGAARAGPTRRGIEQSHAKLRSATSGLGLGRPGMRSREPSSGPDDGNSKQRYALQDPGASRPHSPNDNPGENQRYQLSDAVSSSRHEDSIDASDDVVLSEISSVRVSRRGKVQSRPNGLKIHARKSIEDLNGVGDDVRRSTSLIGAVEANLPSPLMEEPATPPRKVDNIVELGYAPSDSQYGQLKRSSRMVRLDSTRSSKSAQGDEASGVETTPEGLRRDKDGYGDLLDNYAALEDL